jgi:2'-hydroxyisoflavone reductase
MELLGLTDLVWIPAQVLEAAGLTWQELPLYRQETGDRANLMDIDNSRALAAGLRLSAPGDTLRAVRDALTPAQPIPLLSPEREAELIARVGRKSNR